MIPFSIKTINKAGKSSSNIISKKLQLSTKQGDKSNEKISKLYKTVLDDLEKKVPSIVIDNNFLGS